MRTIATNNNVTAVKVMNSKSIMSKMRVLMLAVMAMLALGFASCSSSDDDNDVPGGGGSKATQMEVTPEVYIADDMLQYFDITYKYNGETVQLTKANTQATTVTVNGISYDVLKYTGNSSKLTSFPATTEASASVTLKDGVDLTKVDAKVKYTLGIKMLTKNNAGSTLNIDQTSISQTQIDIKRAVEKGKESLFLKTITAKLTCPDAESGSVTTK